MLVLPFLLLCVGATWRPASTARIAIWLGFASAAALTDSFLVEPLADLSGRADFFSPKLIPYAFIAAGSFLAFIVPRPRGRAPVPLRLLLAYCLLALIGALASPFLWVAVPRWIQGFIPLLGALAILRLGGERLLLYAILGAALWYVSAGVAIATGLVPEAPYIMGGRLATFTHPVLGAFCAAVVAAWALTLLSGRRAGQVALGLLLLAAAGVVLWASKGRTGTIAAVTMAIALAVVGLFRRRAPLRVLWVLVAMVIAIAVGADVLWEWFTRSRPQELLTLTGRTRLWHVVWDMIVERPLVGWGPGLLRTRITYTTVGFGGHAHNALLEAALSAGLLGAVVWGGAVLALGVGLLRRFLALSGNRVDDSMMLAATLWVGLVTFSVSEGGPAGFGFSWFLLVALAAVSESGPTIVGGLDVVRGGSEGSRLARVSRQAGTGAR